MNRRDFVTVLGGAVVTTPFTARAQQKTMPVIGYLSQRDPLESASIVAAFRQGLKEAGYIEGQNVAIEFRYAEGEINRLPGLATDLVHRGVSVFVATGGTAPALAAKAATTTIPIVFAMGGDPVTSLAHPGDNITGVSFMINELAGKEIELLHEFVPKAAIIGLLTDPNDPNTESDIKSAQSAADALGHRLVVIKTSTASEIGPAFAALAQQRITALFVNADPLFNVNSTEIITLSIRYAMLTVSSWEGFAADGGLISYGARINEANHQLGVYTGRVLKGARPGDLPVVRPTAFKLVINLKTAKALGLPVPPSILAQATEVIE